MRYNRAFHLLRRVVVAAATRSESGVTVATPPGGRCRVHNYMFLRNLSGSMARAFTPAALLATWLALVLLSLGERVQAQAEFDLDGPEILHEPKTAGNAGSTIDIAAVVRDNVGVKTVVLYYRASDSAPFVEVQMNASEVPDAYIASVETSADQRVLIYYVVARDISGNTVSMTPKRVLLTAAQSGPAKGRFALSVTPANASVCFYMEVWRCGADVQLPLGREYPVYAAASGYEKYEGRVLLERDGQELTLQLVDPAAATAPAAADTLAPVIGHSPAEQPQSGAMQSFSARVTDETGVDAVILHYRIDDGAWRELAMRGTGGDNYLATVDVDEQQRRIDYYLRARNLAGNEASRGQPSAPLQRLIAEVAVAQAPAVAPPAEARSRSSLIYIVLGVLVGGALIAGAAGGGGGDGGEQPTGTVSETFTVNIPPLP